MSANLSDLAAAVLDGRMGGGEAVMLAAQRLDSDDTDATSALMSAINALRGTRSNTSPIDPAGGPPIPVVPPQESFGTMATLDQWAGAARGSAAYHADATYRQNVEAVYAAAKQRLSPPEETTPPSLVPPPLPTPPPFSPPSPPPPVGKLGEAATASAAALGLGQSQAGLGRQFEEFLSQEPFGHLNPLFQNVTESRGKPLAALFTLLQGLQPGQKTPEEKRNQFLSFLAAQPQQDFFGPVGGQMEGFLQQIKDKLFSDQPEAGANSQDVTDVKSRRAELEGDAENIITQYYLEHSNPLVRPFVPDVVRQRIRALQFQNPDIELLKQFIAQEFKL